MEVEIRRATPEDLETLQELDAKLFKREHDNYDKLLNLEWTRSEEGAAYFRKMLGNEEDRCFIAFADGKAVGFVVGGRKKASLYRNVRHQAELDSIFVIEEYQSKGVGKMLTERFLSWCKEKGFEKVRVDAYPGNKRALEFYRKHGFEDHLVRLEKDI
jgi:ribosomal protein S18 acetylase RimI-like enzyme